MISESESESKEITMTPGSTIAKQTRGDRTQIGTKLSMLKASAVHISVQSPVHESSPESRVHALHSPPACMLIKRFRGTSACVQMSCM